ncbi:MAG TPA: NAD-dependent epimerase/dehydratase family protein [Lacipirellulaceae bacterium]|jgi:nucleoside-diphosphate-sugar epimerase
MTKLIFGCGYLGERVAQRWQEAGHKVVVVTRSRERAEGFARRGYETIVADITLPDTLINLPLAETVLFAIGFDRTVGQSIETVYASGLRNVLAALPSQTGRVIYISTTGVYRDTEGDWIDEETPPDPQREGGRASLSAELALAEHPLGGSAAVLRLAGIYGPGRIPFRSLLRAGAPIPAASEGWLNLIHVVDAASVVVAAAEATFDELGRGPRIYCVSDGHPVQRGDYYREVARIIGAPEPALVAPQQNSPRAARAANDRRVRNVRMLAELPVKLVFPDYRAGLAAILG